MAASRRISSNVLRGVVVPRTHTRGVYAHSKQAYTNPAHIRKNARNKARDVKRSATMETMGRASEGVKMVMEEVHTDALHGSDVQQAAMDTGLVLAAGTSQDTHGTHNERYEEESDKSVCVRESAVSADFNP